MTSALKKNKKRIPIVSFFYNRIKHITQSLRKTLQFWGKVESE